MVPGSAVLLYLETPFLEVNIDCYDIARVKDLFFIIFFLEHFELLLLHIFLKGDMYWRLLHQ